MCKFFCGTYHIVADKFAESKFFSGQPVSIPTTSQEIKQIAMPAQQQPNTAAPQATPECVGCRAKLELGSLFCTHCLMKRRAMPADSLSRVAQFAHTGLESEEIELPAIGDRL